MTLVSGETINGTIRSIDKESFVILCDGKQIQVKYDQVNKVERKPFAAGAKAAIAVGAFCGVLLGIFAVLSRGD